MLQEGNYTLSSLQLPHTPQLPISIGTRFSKKKKIKPAIHFKTLFFVVVVVVFVLVSRYPYK